MADAPQLEERPFYGVEAPLSPWMAIFAGVQHVLAMFVGIITPPLIVAGALGLDRITTGFLVSMALFTSGVTTFFQVRRFRGIGSGLLSVQGTSFTFVPLALQAGQVGGLPLIFGLTITAAPLEIVMSRFIGVARKLFPPVVTGTVVILIGMSLIGVGMKDLAGGVGAEDFGSIENVSLGLFVLCVIVLLHRFGRGFVWTVSIAFGLLAGFVVALAVGRVDLSGIGAAPWFALPVPGRFGFDFDAAHLLPWLIGYMVTTIESMGDLTATCAVSREPVSGDLFFARVKGGVLCDGLGSMFAGLFNAMPNTTFSQNNGVIALTGVASRRAGVAVAASLVLLGLLPKLAFAISVMPKPVLGGATLVMFATVAMAGFGIIARDGLTPHKQLVVAVSLALGLGVTFVPDAFAGLAGAGATEPSSLLAPFVRAVAQSGLALGAITAILLNLLFSGRPEPS